MTAVTATVEVSRPATDVYDYATDPTRFHQWQKGVIDGHLEAAQDAKVGDHCVSVRRIGFANRPITSEITRIEAPHHWGVRGIDGPIRAEVEVTVEALIDSRSRLTITLDFQGRGIGRLLVPLVVIREARKEMPANLEQLRQQLES
jgi:uncharacterized protein YndB with AHSA1/START domain